ncbi:hypothetical protein GIB67_035078 [Kingdonia uniflora]|uniref:Uncharacterized protein n=1 Tax=Kingdonia uniflora TaxID=39325 RepID=A0A7J7L1R5_9MAGN|nr:hypothetical protein GIB67_035078 [Kingdonia uniflora]
MGRKRVYGMNLMIMVICSVASRLPLAKVLNQLCYSMFLQNFSWRDGWNYPSAAFKDKFDAPSYEVDPIGPTVLKLITFGDLLKIFSTVGWIPAAKTMNAVEEVYKIARAQTLIALSVAGKAGAIIGAFGFLYAAQSQDKTKIDVGYHVGIGVKNSLIMLGVINFFGMLFTLLVPESNGRSLELRIEVKNAAQSQDKTKTDAGYHAGIGVKNSLIMLV